MMMVMMMVATAHMKMIGTSAQATEQEPETHAGDHEAADKTQDHLHFRRHRLWKKKHEQRRQHDDGTRVRDRGYDAKEQRMPGRASLTDKIGGNQSFAMAGRQCVSRAKAGRQDQEKKYAPVVVE